MIFGTVLAIFCLLSLGLLLYARRTASADEQLGRPEFLRFQRVYLAVYSLAVAGDWLQGPHVYALYQSYWMSKHQIELLFIAGFGSSLLFGTFIGSIADKFGRKTNCLLYALLYGLGCLSKHFADFPILLIGRLLGGISTSILFSAFESWLIHEHKKQKFSEQSLKHLFANATLANSLIAILAGLLAQLVANLFGYVAPFDCALLLLALMALVCSMTWSENYGDEKARLEHSFLHSLQSIRDDRRILYLGLVQSLFEGSMYVFVLEWTPALSSATGSEQIPHGLIFASFMLAVMAGSALFNVLCQRGCQPESFMRFVFFGSALSLLVPILLPDQPLTIFASFNLFELCVGIFWPALGFLRSKYVPEETRATTMNFFRVPLNLLVICLLYQNLTRDVIFLFCVLFLLLATLIQQSIHNLVMDVPCLMDDLEQEEQLIGDGIGPKTKLGQEDEEEEIDVRMTFEQQKQRQTG